MGILNYSVKPRYTSGSPAHVPMEVAERVAAEERAAYDRAKQGHLGEEAHEKALELGLDRIVVRYLDDMGARYCYDCITGAAWKLMVNGEHLDVHTLPARLIERDSNRPDFAGFAKALRDEAEWSATIHKDDKTNQAASDQAALNRLAATVERVGKNLGYI